MSDRLHPFHDILPDIEPIALLTADEWFDVCRRVRPDLSRDEFDELWVEFQRIKRERMELRHVAH